MNAALETKRAPMSQPSLARLTRLDRSTAPCRTSAPTRREGRGSAYETAPPEPSIPHPDKPTTLPMDTPDNPAFLPPLPRPTQLLQRREIGRSCHVGPHQAIENPVNSAAAFSELRSASIDRTRESHRIWLCVLSDGSRAITIKSRPSSRPSSR